MFRKTTCLALLLISTFLVHDSTAETIDDVISDLGPKIGDLQTRIGLIIHDGGTLLGNTYASIARIVTVAQANVGTQINELGNIIDEAKAEAQANGKDIQSCIDSANSALLTLDLNGLEKCRSAEELDRLGVQLGHLGETKGELGQVISNCKTAHPTDTESLRSCIEDKITNINKEASRIQEIIKSTCDNSKKNTNACVAATLGYLDLGIDKISHDFKDCYSNS